MTDAGNTSFQDLSGLTERPASGVLDAVRRVDPFRYEGQIVQVVGTLLEARIPGVAVGTLCEVTRGRGRSGVLAEVVGFRGGTSLLMAFDSVVGVTHGSRVRPIRSDFKIPVGEELLGRVLGPMGEPLDDLGSLGCSREVSIFREAPDPLRRRRIREPLAMGVRAIDSMLTIGKGQRMGIMSGTGVGKSTLLGMVARSVEADVSVIALIGERGREVREFIEEALGEEGMRRSVVVAVTGDASPVLRVKGALVATTIAEYFRDRGKDVLFMMDSVTRLAMAQREIGLATGEPPTARGYTPSVFSMLPKVLERCGTQLGGGSITGIFTVLVEGDDLNDPIADATRGILDGHIVLSRELAARNHFPAIDVLSSASRVMRSVVHPQQVKDAGEIRELLAIYRDAEELVNIGAYRPGSNPRIDRALQMIEPIRSFLRQDIDDDAEPEGTLGRLAELALAGRLEPDEYIPQSAEPEGEQS
ncbi:MAG: FliI/YscN family ATPase [Myxococcota bacterium]|nr:FliI/YscN family ATPase [Myxococcota bacterium]